MTESEMKSAAAAADASVPALAERLLDLVPAEPSSAEAGTSWMIRRKSDFNTTDVYGDP